MSSAPPPLVLSAGDREQISQVDRLAESGAKGVEPLVVMLTDRSWAVRRAVVAALAREGDAALPALVKVLVQSRGDEARIAAVVDTLSASRGDAARAMLEVIARESNPPVLCDAAQVLGRRKAMNSVRALEKLVSNADDNVSVAAIEALGRIGGGAGLDTLIAVLGQNNFFRIFPALDVLGRSGAPRVLESLVGLLENPRYALEAARALGMTGETGAAAPLAQHLRRANDGLTRAIALSLFAIHARAQERFGSAEAVEQAVRGTEDPLALVQHAARSVAGARQEEQVALCAVLAWTRDETAAATLIALLDATPDAVAPALRALGRESDPQLLQALREGDSGRRALLLPLVGTRTRNAADVLPSLDDTDVAVRVLACTALARIGDVAAVPRLFELLRDKDPMLSQAAVGAIHSLGSAETERLALAAANDPQPHVRRSGLRIVAYFAYPRGLQLLIDAVQGDDDRLRDAAINGLALMDDPRAMEALLHTAVNANARARAAAMRALGQASAAALNARALLKGLGDPDAWVRYYACQAMGKLRDSVAVADILPLVRDPAGQVRVAAIEALANLESPDADRALRDAAASDDLDVQRAALLGLGARGQPSALPALLAGARSNDPATRQIALAAIAQQKAPEALSALTNAATDPDSSVRDAAINFLSAREDMDSTSALISLLTHPLSRARSLDALSTTAQGRIAGIAAALEGAGADLAGALIAALARMKRADSLAAIIDALSLPNLPVRRAAALALAAIHSPHARAALERAVDSDPDSEVRRICLAALGP